MSSEDRIDPQPILPQQMAALEKRISELEESVARLVDVNTEAQRIDEALRNLGQKIVGTTPNMSYFNQRFKEFELLQMNVKNLIYALGSNMIRRRSQERVFSAPLQALASKICTQADMDAAWFQFWCGEMKSEPAYHRKQWELCYISHVLWCHGNLAPGKKGLGFGCGAEPLPSLFAKYGVQVLATDLEPDHPDAQAWIKTGQHANTLESIRLPDICPDPDRLRQIDFRPVDMNAIPNDLKGVFDFCWSACALEHLGTMERGLSFIENSLATLKPGGTAVHTTEYNFGEGETLDGWATVFYQKKHLSGLAEKLRTKGFSVVDFDFSPGDGMIDNFVDIHPVDAEGVPSLSPTYAHLRNSCDGYACTSIGIIINVPK